MFGLSRVGSRSAFQFVSRSVSFDKTFGKVRTGSSLPPSRGKGFVGQTRTGYLCCVDISHLSPVIPSESRNLKSVNGVCATI